MTFENSIIMYTPNIIRKLCTIDFGNYILLESLHNRGSTPTINIFSTLKPVRKGLD